MPQRAKSADLLEPGIVTCEIVCNGPLPLESSEPGLVEIETDRCRWSCMMIMSDYTFVGDGSQAEVTFTPVGEPIVTIYPWYVRAWRACRRLLRRCRKSLDAPASPDNLW